jgi:hypothetical protein
MQGKIKYCLLLLFCCCSLTFGQSADSVSAARKFEVGVSLLYCHPNLDDFNQGFSKLEQDLHLSLSNDFKISYLVLPSIIYRLNRKTQIAIQLGGSYLERSLGDKKNYYFLWTAGGEYRYIPLSFKIVYFPADLCVSLGGGMIGAKFHREYDADVAINESVSNFYINGGVSLCVDMTKRIGMNIDVRYLFTPKKKLEVLKSDISLKSIMAGMGISYSF